MILDGLVFIKTLFHHKQNSSAFVNTEEFFFDVLPLKEYGYHSVLPLLDLCKFLRKYGNIMGQNMNICHETRDLIGTPL